jgi:hypothetical protein
MLIAGLTLWTVQALAQPSQPSYSADGLYNLANAYARAGKPGLAVLSYERAALLAPDDPDINANLAYVRASAHVPLDAPNRLTRVVEAVRPEMAAWLGVVGLALVGMGLLAKRVVPRWRWGPGTAILLGLAMLTLTATNAVLAWPRMHEAIVLVDQTPARVAPVPMSDTAFVLREADSVTVRAGHEDFILIRTKGGLTGWVARANMGAVVPPAGVE